MSRTQPTHLRHLSASSVTPPSSPQITLQSATKTALTHFRTLLSAFLTLTPLQRIFASIALALLGALAITLLLFSHALFSWLAPLAQGWRALPGGWVPVWLMVFCTAFPPVIGYSFANTLAGFVFGFPMGWPVVASAATAGSVAAFIASRTILSGYVNRLVGRDPRFVAFGQVLRRDGLLMLTMIRFCPLPFSLSNGFLATIPSITPLAFAMSTALSSPKLLVHVFIGSRLALLAEHGDDMTVRDKAINYLGMIIGGAVGVSVGYVIYRRTMARAEEIARDEDVGSSSTTSTHSQGPGTPDYADIEAGLLDPDRAAELLGDDLAWDAPESAYRDGN